MAERKGLLDGKTLLVTGGAMGIGKAIAKEAALEGATVVIADVDMEGAEATAAGIRESGGTARAFTTDVSDFASVERLASALSDDGLSPHALVNNAATWTIKPFLQTTPEDWKSDLSVSLMGTLNMCRIFVPGMIERGGGSIVNIASDAARVGERYWSVYSAAKGGVVSFTKSLALEHGKDGIRVNAISPGLTRTEKVKAFVTNQEKVAKRYPLKRLAEPEDIARAVVFLSSDQASFITGQVLSVNGGYSMAG